MCKELLLSDSSRLCVAVGTQGTDKCLCSVCAVFGVWVDIKAGRQGEKQFQKCRWLRFLALVISGKAAASSMDPAISMDPAM